jgi:pyruvate decarboxylase
MPKSIPLARHIFNRLSELNCKTIHGVPGDFFLRGLDHIAPSGLKWIGNANELCAGYAADGYARATLTGLSRRKYAQTKSFASTPAVGAVMTTYGVGELSAINAVAGAYSEHVPLVHLVSTPSRKAMRAGEDLRRPVHHCLPGRGMEVYAEMTKAVTCAQAELFKCERLDEAAERVDEVLECAVRESKPVYLAVGCDMWEREVPVEVGERALEVKPPLNIGKEMRELVEEIWALLANAERPLVIADALCWPFDLQNEVDEFVRLTGLPAMSYASGKGVVEEERESWSRKLPNTTEYSKDADVVLIFGPLLSDTNTARWSTIPEAQTTVMFNLDFVEVLSHPTSRDTINEAVWQDMRSKEVLQALLKKAATNKLPSTKDIISNDGQQTSSSPPRTTKSSDLITQDALWPELSSYLRTDDALLFANGTPLIGGRSMALQQRSHVIASGIWNAIGSLLPAAQGVAAAKRDHDLPGRTIIFEGDGSLQVTVQAISDIIRYRLDVTIVIANNGGYTYERWLNGMEAEYNDVPPWRYTEAASFFGAKLDDPTYPIYARRIENWGELLEVLEDEKTGDGKGLKIIDVVMDPKDVPEASKAGLLRAAESLRLG